MGRGAHPTRHRLEAGAANILLSRLEAGATKDIFRGERQSTVFSLLEFSCGLGD
jgi:hypothetical protein